MLENPEYPGHGVIDRPAIRALLKLETAIVVGEHPCTLAKDPDFRRLCLDPHHWRLLSHSQKQFHNFKGAKSEVEVRDQLRRFLLRKTFCWSTLLLGDGWPHFEFGNLMLTLIPKSVRCGWIVRRILDCENLSDLVDLTAHEWRARSRLVFISNSTKRKTIKPRLSRDVVEKVKELTDTPEFKLINQLLGPPPRLEIRERSKPAELNFQKMEIWETDASWGEAGIFRGSVSRRDFQKLSSQHSGIKLKPILLCSGLDKLVIRLKRSGNKLSGGLAGSFLRQLQGIPPKFHT